jgi:hypothetical protein
MGNSTQRSLGVGVIAVAAVMMAACGHKTGTAQNAASTDRETAAIRGPASPQPSEQTPAVGTTGSTPTEERDPNAIAALEHMGAYLRTLKAFQVKSETSRDDVLDDGQKVAYDGTVDMLVQRPDRLRAEVTSDRQQRHYFYDGKTFTLWARRVNYYATISAPPTIAQLVDQLDEQYGLEVPLVDLFYWGSDRKNTADITGAKDVGASQVEGVSCDHYVFRQPGVDWQVWIQLGDYPLPRKLVITTTTDAARPQFTSVMTWNLAPSYNDAAFTFDPPKDAQKITFWQPAANESGK